MTIDFESLITKHSNTIGVLFFWGLQKSLLDTWMPNLYLTLYLVFIVLSVLGGIWLKNNMTSQKIQPLLDKLYTLKKELGDTGT